jgi:hypothetical protein
MEKRGGARACAVRVVKSLFGAQIPASIEALSKHVRAPRGLIAAWFAAKSGGA